MFTYSQLEEIWNTRRKGNHDKPLAGATRLRKEGDDMVVKFYFTDIVRITPDNIVTVNTGGYSDSPATRERIMTYGGVSIWSDSRTNGLEDRVRCSGDLPFSRELKFRNGVCLNPEICVDRITTLKRSAITEVTKQLRPLRTLCMSLARINAFDKSFTRANWASIDLEDPQFVDAQMVYGHGQWQGSIGKTAQEYVEIGLKALREHLYEYMDAHNTEEIRYGQDQRIAA
jgi:hypothetical protein